ncbi:heptaprenyl diphosphate synthase component 1 [Paenibacillus xanthanilyticus]|uniref:Heptaprenyl diphosphate synthase component 1 n=1 Tax=Paenibacillus xanthanilyticus TaxID=1783531 RepID=A0ABV8KCL3_9BACL
MNAYTIADIARKYVDYDMIQSHTELPFYPDSRTRLLFAFLANPSAPNPNSELYALVTSLVQLGMDIHDRIDNESGPRTEPEMRSRQLKVLAGDYYSSRFFHLLAQAGQVHMIRLLSEGVCEVNRLKMNFYMRMKQRKLTAEQYWRERIGIATELFAVFTGILDDKSAGLWTELLLEVGRCEVAVSELSRCGQPELFTESWGYWHALEAGSGEERSRLMEMSEPDSAFIRSIIEKHDIVNLLHEKLTQSAQRIQRTAEGLDSGMLASELAGIGEAFLLPPAPAASVLGERR